MIHCQRCQNEIPDEDCLTRAAELGWLHPEEIDAVKSEYPDKRIFPFYQNKRRSGMSSFIKKIEEEELNGIQNP